MASPSQAASVSAVALWVLAVLATVFFLRAASTFLIPIALGVLISYPLEPVVAWLERHRVPRAAGAAVVLLAVLGAAAAGLYTLRDQAGQLMQQLPEAAERAREMVVTQLGIDGDAVQRSSSLLQLGATTLMAFVGHLVVIVFLVFFLLLSGDDARNRIVEICGPDAEDRKTAATIIGDIHQQIQRYLLVLLVTGAIVGVFTWMVLAWMKVPHAIMWAFLAGVFNSIPYFGPVVVSGGLFVVGMVQGGGLTPALQMGGATLLITSLEGWLITPPLMGKAERMSALAVFLGLLLWTWVWGAWGTLLAVPMLVIIKSVADHIPRLKPLGRLMAP